MDSIEVKIGPACLCEIEYSSYPAGSRSWESPENADNVWVLFIQILLC